MASSTFLISSPAWQPFFLSPWLAFFIFLLSAFCYSLKALPNFPLFMFFIHLVSLHRKKKACVEKEEEEDLQCAPCIGAKRRVTLFHFDHDTRFDNKLASCEDRDVRKPACFSEVEQLLSHSDASFRLNEPLPLQWDVGLKLWPQIQWTNSVEEEEEGDRECASLIGAKKAVKPLFSEAHLNEFFCFNEPPPLQGDAGLKLRSQLQWRSHSLHLRQKVQIWPLAIRGLSYSLIAQSKVVKLWYESTESPLERLPFAFDDVAAIAANWKTQLAAVGESDGTVSIWDLNKAQCVNSFSAGEDLINYLTLCSGPITCAGVSCIDQKGASMYIWDGRVGDKACWKDERHAWFSDGF